MVPIGRLEVPINLIDSSKALKSLKIRFESSTMALTNLTTFAVAAGATVFAIDDEVEDQ
jgi:hypothetical protein